MKVGAIFFGALVAALAGWAGWTLGAATTAQQLASSDDTAATLFVGHVGGGIAVAAAIIAVWGVYSQRVLTRRQATIQHIASLKADRSIQAEISKFIELSKGDENLAQWANACHEGTDNAQAINAVLNIYELMSVGIQHGIFEYRLIHQWQKSTILRYWDAAHPYVVALRQRVGKPSIWCEFEKMADWVSGKKNPFFALWWTGFH
jgi:hypothetical protein